MKPTIYDVAEKAGVSIATVSKVINNTGKIGAETKENVLQVMNDINYYPSMLASAMMGKRTNTIGLLVPDIANPFFAELARSIEDTGQEKGYNVVICNTDNNPEKEIQYLEWLKQKSTDGVVIATGVQKEETFKELIKENIPFALISRNLSSIPVDTVLLDDYLGGYQAGAHLILTGCRNAICLTLNVKTSSEKERLRGFKKALLDHEITYNEEYTISCDGTIENSTNVINDFLKVNKNIDAIFALNDMIAIGAVNGARSFGYNIPEDISIIGFDNTILATISHPPLTSIAQPIEDMGSQVIHLLVETIEGKKQSKKQVILSP